MKLDDDNRNFVMKYAFSLANGNHILQHTEEEYRDYLLENKEMIPMLFTIRFISDNWGYEDERYFEFYDEQWIATKVDPVFKCHIDFKEEYFDVEKLIPWQKTIVEFTKRLIIFEIDGKPVIERLLDRGTPLEMIYSVIANVMEFDGEDGEVLNSEYTIERAFEMVKVLKIDGYKPGIPFELWETEII